MELWRAGVLLGHVHDPEPDRWDSTTLTGAFDPAPAWCAVEPLFAAEVLHLRWADRDDACWAEWRAAADAAQGPGVHAREPDGTMRPVFLRVSEGRAEVRTRPRSIDQ
jgi:hypothetical protein